MDRNYLFAAVLVNISNFNSRNLYKATEGAMILYQQDNSRAGENNDIRIFESFNFMTHMHRDLELAFVLEGTLEITVEDTTYHVTAGEMALIFSNQIHAYASPVPSRVMIHVFSPDNVRSFIRKLDGRVGKSPLFCCDKIIRDFYYTCLIENHYRSSLAIKSYLYIICDRYLESADLVNTSKVSDNILHKMLQYISLHFREDITLVGMSDVLGYEPHYLSRVFGKAIGINLRRYINEYRVDYAKYRLSETQDSITDIALSSGFQSIRNFNRVFLECEGITPQDFRKHTGE